MATVRLPPRSRPPALLRLALLGLPASCWAQASLAPVGRSRLTCEQLSWWDGTRACPPAARNPLRVGHVGAPGVCGQPLSECSLGAVSHSVAERYCTGFGARLCTAAELRLYEASAGGCALDVQFVWSSTPCQQGHGFDVVKVLSCLEHDLPVLTCRRHLAFGGRCCADPADGVAPMQPRVVAGESPRIFVLAGLSHDDVDQWALLTHWFDHYFRTLQLRPEHFLLILHSDAGNITGLQNMARWFRREYGVVHTRADTNPYQSKHHMVLKYELLHRFVALDDWVMQVDADELVMFPRGATAAEALRRAELEQKNVYFSVMVDRLSANGDVDVAPVKGRNIFESFPLNCACTPLLQSSDFRKVSAYKGYLRTTSGNHNTISVNASAAKVAARNVGGAGDRVARRMRGVVRDTIGDRAYNVLPESYTTEGRPLPVASHMGHFATAFHFKWIRGLAEKLRRRSITESYSVGAYSDLRHILSRTTILPEYMMKKLCKFRDGSGKDTLASDGRVRALTGKEMIELFSNARREHIDEVMRQSYIPPGEEEAFVDTIFLNSINGGIARENIL